MIEVKSIKNKTEDDTLYGVKQNKDGNFVEQTLPEVVKKIEKETSLSKGRNNFTDMTIKELDHQLEKFIKAITTIKKHMMNGIHYLEIPGMEKPIITKQGTAWLAAATNMTVTVKEVKEIINTDKDLIFYQHEATCSWGGSRSVSAQGSANSQEYNQRRKYEDEKSQKTVFDTLNDVLQMSQKRARVQAIKEMIAMTDIFETNEDNPLANKRKQMGIYTLFYKNFMKYAPVAPTKTKLKNGKWKTFTEKERLNWQKEYLKSKHFTPRIYEMGMPTYGNWGIKDIEKLETEIPKWSQRYMELSKNEKELIEITKNN